MDSIDINGIKEAELFDFWTATLNQKLMPIWLEPTKDSVFKFDMDARSLNDLAIVDVSGAGCNAIRGRQEIARSSAHFYLVSLHLAGETTLVCNQAERQLHPGDIFIIDTMNQVTLGLERPYQHLIVKIPKTSLDSRIAITDSLFGSILEHENPFTKIYASYLRNCFQMADCLSVVEKEMLSQHLIDLLFATINHGKFEPPSTREARQRSTYAHAKQLISNQFDDPCLSPAKIASGLSISVRTLHRLFDVYGDTVMHSIQQERIKRAALILSSPEMNHKSITEIAFACGFNDLTHFGRVFCEYTGSMPSQWRRKYR